MSPRRAPGETRQAILDAARDQFGAVGYQQATIRRIARSANVDPALVMQYFGSKDELLAECLTMPVDVRALVAGIESEPEIGTALVRRVLTAWEEPHVRAAMLSLLRTGLSHERASAALAVLVSRGIFPFVERFAAADDSRFRAALVGTQIGGLAIGRMALRVPALVEPSVETLARAVGPTITRYLTGDLT